MEIDSIRDLQRLLKTCRLTVGSVEELEGVLARIKAGYDPDAARVRAARRIGATVPVVGAVMAFLTSFYLVPISLVSPLDHSVGVWPRVVACLGGLGIVWGLWAVVSLVAVLRSFSILRSRPSEEHFAPPRMPTSTGSTAIRLRSQNVTRPDPF
jgi:hypothetical protein